TAVTPGHTNRSLVVTPYVAHDPVQNMLGTRIFRIRQPGSAGPPATTQTDLTIGYSTTAKAEVKSSATLPLSMTFTSAASAGASVAEGMYQSLIRDDRPLAWWGFDTTPTLDETLHGFNLTASGAPAQAATLLARANELNGTSADFDGASAY